MSRHLYKELKLWVRTICLLCCLVGCLPVNLYGEEIFEELTKMDAGNVESTYISGRWADRQLSIPAGSGMGSFDLSEGFSALYNYNCYSESAVQKARRILETYLKKSPEMELIMRKTDGTGEYMIYQKFVKKNILKQMIIWSSDTPCDCYIVVIDWDEGLQR